MKSLDTKLAKIKADRSSRDFIIADAKDADMAFGVSATGKREYLSLLGEHAAQFSPEVWTREEFGYRKFGAHEEPRRTVQLGDLPGIG